ncbi:MAG: FecR family protein [Rubripirellula sp.]|nr:FecR family protein [Rubripirellula sp.]
MTEPEITLLEQYIDGTLPEGDIVQLRELLKESSVARAMLRSLATVDFGLQDIASCNTVSDMPVSGEGTNSPNSVHPQWTQAAANSSLAGWKGVALIMTSIASVAAVGLLGLLAVEWWSGDESAGDRDSLTASEVRLAEVRYSHGATLQVQQPMNEEHDQDGASYRMRLSRGTYSLGNGFVELDFFGGAVLAVEGPAEIELISQREARLFYGRVTVEAGDAQISFLLHTPVGEVLDIGTRYGVYVREDGVTETHVFEGLVDIQPTESRKAARRIRAETAIKLTTSGVAEALTVSESAFPQPTRRIANLLLNSDFEPGTELQVGEAEVGRWGGDVCRVVGEHHGIRPFSGDGMLLFQSTGRGRDGRASATAASQLSQWIDVTPFRSAIAEGRVRVKLRARFNRVTGDEKTDSQFTINLESFGVPPEEARRLLKSHPQIPRSRASCTLLSDSKPESWEDIKTSLALPPGTQCLQAEVLAFENVLNDQDDVSEFDGHFADHLQFELIVEPAGSEVSMNLQ